MSTDYSLGAVYSPSTTSSTGILSMDQLEDLNISYIRLQWIDLFNTLRCRILSLSYFRTLLKSNRPGIGVAKSSMAVGTEGEYFYEPDLSTMRLCPYAPGEAVVMGWFKEKTPYLGVDNRLTVDIPHCPRATLQRVVQKASTAGVEFLVGFESEFILLKSTKPVVPASYHQMFHPWCNANAILSGSVEFNLLREIADGIQVSGIELQAYHSEEELGQYEIITGPLPPLEAADALVHTRAIIVNIASRHGLRATFAPRSAMGSSGSAADAHISIHSKTTTKVAENLSPLESSFLSSILVNLPALTAITLPIPASYTRMADGIYSSGTYVNWGTETREVPIRLCNATSPFSRNFEMRFMDGTANPYLALAGILGAGLDGIKNEAQLTIQDCPGRLTAAQMTEEGRQKLGITQRMSLTWEESRQRLIENKLLTEEVLGRECTERYLAANEPLLQKLADRLKIGVENDEGASLTRLVEWF